MNTKPKILVISRSPYGKLVDALHHTQTLSTKYSMSYLGFTKASIEQKNVSLIEISRNGGKIRMNMRFIISSIKKIICTKPDLVLIYYFPGCSILRILAYSTKMALDIRTGNVSMQKWRRILSDFILKLESVFFKTIFIISPLLASRLGFAKNSYKLLPLGGDIYSTTFKEFDSIRLLYVGTLDNRRISDTIEGLRIFFRENPHHRKNISYTIIGEGFWDKSNTLCESIERYGLSNNITILGYIPPDRIGRYFDSHNIGVCYVPVTPYFDVQPATKTYEYLLAGMAVIGTKIQDNLRVLNPANSVLFDDNPASFAEAITTLVDNLHVFNSNNIRESAKQYTWVNVTKQYLQPEINRLLQP